MLIERKQLKKIFIKLIIESYGFEDSTEEIIRWNDPERDRKISSYKDDGRDDYIIQNLDNLDPYSMTHEERIQYIDAVAEKLSREFEAKQKKRKSEKEAKDAAALEAYIEKLKQGKVSDNTMPVGLIYNDGDTLTI